MLHIVTILRCVIMNGKKKMIWKNIWEKLHFVINHNFTYHQIVTTKIMAKCVIIKKNLLFYSSKSYCFSLSLSLAFTFSHNLPYSNHSVPHTSALDQVKTLIVYFVFWILKIKKLEPSTSTEKMTASSDNSANVIDLFKLHYHDLREFDRNESAFED